MGEIDAEGVLHVYVDALHFAREAQGDLAFCEKGVRKWN
jgi:hypothetical protein